ncbi:MAG: cell division protein FtsL [Candidatus Pelagibacter sp.]|tara:strand:- start:1390 stop:1704 length:315 start_codon:yes stop_codon:yes gene_type:complete
MKKFFLISLIFTLILITSLIKNSTKKIEEEIFVLNERILNSNIQLDDLKLEFDYLSSAEKLMNYQKLYFENELKEKKIDEIRSIDFSGKNIEIKKILITKFNEK